MVTDRVVVVRVRVKVRGLGLGLGVTCKEYVRGCHYVVTPIKVYRYTTFSGLEVGLGPTRMEIILLQAA